MNSIRHLLLLIILLNFAEAKLPAVAAGMTPLVASWINAQTNIQSWEADFLQTRTLKALAHPLTATGHVWFAAPNRFRWELGHPAQTIAVRAAKEMLVIYPRLKRVESYPLAGGQTGPWRDALGLLEAGFPRSQTELEAQYRVLSQTTANQTGELTLQPKSETARRMMPQIKIAFDTTTFALRSTELQFADGSTMRNDFKDSKANPKIDDRQFAPSIPAGYKMIEPLKQ